jgi:hypothetical protein
MSMRPDDVIREFVARIDRLDPEAVELGELEIGWRGATERVTVRLPVARALAEALVAYHDPRDHGTCAHCGTGRLDGDFVCRDCGVINGVFGQTLARFAAQDQPAIDG